MNTMHRSVILATILLLATGCTTICGPGTVETDGGGWSVERDTLFTPDKVCLPVSPVTDCTDFQMVEEDGGGWSVERDGGGWSVDRDGGGWSVERDGGGWRKERDEPHHPSDAGEDLKQIVYVPTGVCRIGVEVPES